MASSVAEARRRLTIEATTRGVQEAARDLDRLQKAQDGVAIAGQRQERATQTMERRLASIQRQYDANYRAQTQMARVERDLAAAQQQGLVSSQRRVELLSLTAEKLGLASSLSARATAAIKAETVATQQLAVAQRAQNVRRMQSAANDNSQFRRQNLGYQLFDFGQMQALGQSLPMTLLQQGPQIAQLYAMQGGLNALWKDAIGLIGGLVRVAGPWIAAAAAIYGAYKLIASYGADAAFSVDDATRALAEQAAPLDSVRSQIDDLQRITDAYARAIRGTAKDQSIASASIIANSEAEFNAKKALLELELKRQQAAIEVARAEIGMAGVGLRRDVSQQVLTNPQLERGGFADPRIGSVPFVRLPDDVTGLAKTLDVLENSPASDKVKELRANLSLTEIAARSLEEALKITFGESAAISEGRIARTGGKTEAEKLAEKYQAILRDANQAVDGFKRQEQALFLTEKAAARLRYEQELLNKAQDAGIALSPEMEQALRGIAGVMAEAEAAYKHTAEAIAFGKDLVRGFIGDLRSGLEQGKGFWESFGNAAMGVLNRIVDKLLNDVIDALFQVNRASAGSGGGGIGGVISSIFGGLFGGGFKQTGSWAMANAFPFASGGYTGAGGMYEPAGVVHRGEYVFSQRATDRLGVGYLEQLHRYAKGYADGGHVAPAPAMPRMHAPANDSGPTTIRLIMPEGWRSEVVDEARNGARQDAVQIVEDYDRQMPDRVAAIQQHPRRR